MEDQQKSPNWWLFQHGRTTGPHNEEYILSGLKSGAIYYESQISHVDNKEWIPINECSWFESMDIDFVKPPAPPKMSTFSDSFFTNSRLPKIANWICLYTILIAPVICFLSLLSTFISGVDIPYDNHGNLKLATFDIFMQYVYILYAIIITIVMLVGGLRLRDLRKSGSTIIKVAILADYAFLVFFLFFYTAGFIIIVGEKGQDYVTPFSLTEFISLVVLFVYLFIDTYALIWLHKNRNSLPLTEG